MFPEKPMDSLTPKQWKRYEKASRCHICFKPLNSRDPKKGIIAITLATPEDPPTRYGLGKHSKDIGVITKNVKEYITFSVNIAVDRYVDNDMLLMFERGIRGGIAQAVHCYASANNNNGF